MIAATKRPDGARTEAAAQKVRALASFYGIHQQTLARHFGFVI
jgi:hypothetical protein